MGNLISRKYQKAKAGNWGHPNETQKHVRLKKLIEDDEKIPKYQSKKKKKIRIKPEYYYRSCPFCGTNLKEKVTKIVEKYVRWIFDLVEECPKCKSYKVEECPACKRSTWYNPETKIYKHMSWGCGFVGRKK